MVSEVEIIHVCLATLFKIRGDLRDFKVSCGVLKGDEGKKKINGTEEMENWCKGWKKVFKPNCRIHSLGVFKLTSHRFKIENLESSEKKLFILF